MLVCSRSRTTTKLSVYWKSVRVKLCNILCIHTYKAQEVARADIKRSSSCERKEKVGKRQLQLLISARDTQSIKLHSAQTKTIFSLELCCVLLFLPARERESSYFFSVLHLPFGSRDVFYVYTEYELCKYMHLICVNCFQIETRNIASQWEKNVRLNIISKCRIVTMVNQFFPV